MSAKFDKNKLHEVFRAGKYPQWDSEGNRREVTVTPEDINEIASSYDPQFHQAPFFIGHPTESGAPSFAWVGACVAENGVLYVTCSEVSDEAIELTKKSRYKKISVEIDKYEKPDGKFYKYLQAIALTNLPIVKSLPVLSFAQNKNHGEATEKFCFAADNKFSFTNNSKQKTEMNLSNEVKKFAERIGISVTEYDSDIKVLECAADCIDRLKKKFADDPETVGSLSLWIGKFEARLDSMAQFDKSKAELLVQAAIDSKKILDKQKDHYVKLAMGDGYESVKNIFADMKPLAMFEQNTVQDSKTNPVSEASAQTGTEEKSKWTYSEWEKKDPKGLSALKMSNEKKFKELFKQEYGVEFQETT